MTFIFLVAAQIINIFVSFKLTKKWANYLVISNVIIFFNLVGSLINEQNIYFSHESSIYLVAFSLIMNAGAYGYNLINGSRLRRFSKLNLEGLSKLIKFNEIYIYILIASLVVFFGFSVFFFYHYGIPLFMEDLHYSRRAVQTESYLFYRIFLDMMPITTIILYAKYRIYDDKLAGKLFLVSFALVSFVLILLGFKGFVLWYTVVIIMAINIYSDNIYKIILIMAGIGIASGLLITTYMYSVGISGAFDKFLLRLTQVSAYGYNIMFYEFYPVAQKINTMPFNLNQFLAEWKFGKNSNMAIYSTGLTVTIVGALMFYIGKVGSLLAAFVAGFAMQHVYFLILKYKTSPLFMTYFLYLSYTFVAVVNRGTIVTAFTQPITTLSLLVLFYIIITALYSKELKYRFVKIK